MTLHGNSWENNIDLSGNFAGDHHAWSQNSRPTWINRPSAPNLPPLMVPSQQLGRAISASTPSMFASFPSFVNGFGQFQAMNGARRYNSNPGRTGTSFGSARSNIWSAMQGSGEISPISNMSAASYQPAGFLQAPQAYQPRPIGTPLSPTAAEFSSANVNGPWNATVSPPVPHIVSY